MQPNERPLSSREAFDEAIELLRSDRTRGFNIDIETDSMVFEDRRAERQARIEFITAVSGFLREAVPAATMYPAMAPVLMQILMFGVRGFKVGRELEHVFDEVADQVAEMKPQQGQQPQKGEQSKGGADPQVAMAELKAQMQADMAKLKQEAEIAKRQFALDIQEFQLEQQRVMGDLRLRAEKQRSDAADKQVGRALEAAKLAETHRDNVADATLRGGQISAAPPYGGNT